MRTTLLLCFLFWTVSAQARLGETAEQIAARYGKPLKGVKPESPATVAGIYEKNGFGIIVGFYQEKSYYEQFWKVDPTKKTPALQITEAERETLLKANCSGCSWTGRPVGTIGFPFDNNSVETTYDRSDGLAKATYSDKTKMLVIRSLVVEKQDEENKKKREAEEKKRQQENLKGF